MSLLQLLSKTGRFPPITIQVTPVGRDGNPFNFPKYSTNGNVTAGFLNYNFDSNILVPVNRFSFSFQAPGEKIISKLVQDGDVIFIFANKFQVSAGVVDSVEYSLSADKGEIISIQGRDLMAYCEDRQAVDDTNAPIYLDLSTITDAAIKMITNTRIPRILYQDVPEGKYHFITNPGESWLTAFLRFIEPFNLLTWIHRDGSLVVGRPNFEQDISGTFFAVHSQRRANIIECKVVKNSSQIPNFIIPVWTGQEIAANAVAKSQGFENTAKRPAELFKAGHKIVKTYVTSAPNSYDQQYTNLAQAKADIRAADALLIEAYAKRELARFNMQELLVDIVVPGHYDPEGNPIEVDTTWQIFIEHADVNEKMYCYAAKYNLDESMGQTTTMSLCKLGTIVGDTKF